MHWWRLLLLLPFLGRVAGQTGAGHAWHTPPSPLPDPFSTPYSVDARPIISNYAPVLQVSSSEGYLPETADIGTTVRVSPNMHSESLQILVSDADLKAGMPPATYQYILTGLGATIFAVDQRGFVYLNVNAIDADPPNPSTYQLSVQAREVDTSPIRSSQPVTITIHIIDANDNSPQFEMPIYTANISHVGGDRPVVKVEAHDIDSGSFGQVHYDITQVTGGAEANFWYDDTTNTVMARGQLRPNERYQVVVEATDGGGRSSQSIVIVHVMDPTVPVTLSPLPGMETFSPIPGPPSTTPLSSYSVDEETIQTIVTEIAENTPPNTVIVSLGDEHSDMAYTIVGGNEEGRFAIDQHTGTVSTQGAFDRESTASYSLQVETRSRSVDQHLYWTLVQIAVLDVNDNAPEFVGTQPLRLSLSLNELEDLRPNVVVGRVNVHDRDAEENGRVELGILAPMDNLFTISRAGYITVKGDFTAAHLGEHRLMIFARDHGEPPKETLAHVIVAIKTSPAISFGVDSPSPSLPPPTLPPPPLTTPPPPLLPKTKTPSPGEGERRGSGGLLAALSSLGIPSPIPATPERERLAPVFNPPSISVTVEENRADVEVAQVKASYPDGQPGSISYELIKGDASLFAVNSYSGGIRLLRALDAETEKQFNIQIGTKEASTMATNGVLAHTASVSVVVGDANDWIPAFESSAYSFAVNAETLPGTIVGQVTAFDEDRDPPNNALTYTLVAGGESGHFSISADSGLITLARPVTDLAGHQMTLRVEASDGGEPKQTASATITIMVEGIDGGASSLLPPATAGGVTPPRSGAIQFSQRNYTVSVSEAERPPHLVHVLPVHNKPADTRFVSCSLVTGNYKGAFGISASNDGNCELRTQMELDRESIERYLLNVSVSSGADSDFALVSVTVLDVNDNQPKFVFDNDLSLAEYFAGISADAGAFARVLTVKAEDTDLGKAGLVQYSLDPLSLHSKFFSISPYGEITTKQSIPQLVHVNRISKFELKVVACDSPVSGEQLCAKADVTLVVVKEEHRFRMTTSGLQPQQLRTHEEDMVRSLRASTGRCSLLKIEKMEELAAGADGRPKTDLFWYAIDPASKDICTKDEMRRLFESQSVAMAAGKLRPWFSLDSLSEGGDALARAGIGGGDGDATATEWKSASFIFILLAIVIAVGAAIGICAVCLFWSRYKRSQRSMQGFPSSYPPAKLGTIFLPNPPATDKIYETQMLEMPMSDEDLTMKGGPLHAGGGSACSTRERLSYRNYGREASASYEGDFSIEESMYALNVPGRIDPLTNRLQTLVIPTPDYPAYRS